MSSYKKERVSGVQPVAFQKHANKVNNTGKGYNHKQIDRKLLLANDSNRVALPKSFSLTDKGLFYVDKTDEDNRLFICSPLRVTAYFRDVKNEGHGLVLEFTDRDNYPHTYLMPLSLLECEDREYRSVLADKGLRISSIPKACRLLKVYLKESEPAASARLLSRTGWNNQSFALPHAVYGSSNERLLLQTDGYIVKGALEDWQQKIALVCEGNSRLVFAISCAFAAPLLYLTDAENGGFHFRGASSTGKTTALLVACSVWGSKSLLQRWRATTNGLEALAAQHNDTLLCLDEC